VVPGVKGAGSIRTVTKNRQWEMTEVTVLSEVTKSDSLSDYAECLVDEEKSANKLK
jgi:hypothetical protein